jgi:competence protein ComFB
MNFASLYNYYENLVFDYISRNLVDKYPQQDEEFFLDVACYSLTRLPSRYIRHQIDMVYYLAPGELEEMEKRVVKTVDSAAVFINERSQKNADS